MSEVITRFKESKNPNRKGSPKASARRPGMDAEHLKNIRELPSCISGKGPPCDPHHLKIKGERGVSLRSTDRWAVPLTREEHMEVENLGSRREERWFLDKGIRCYELANALWGARGFKEVMLKIIEAHRG